MGDLFKAKLGEQYRIGYDSFGVLYFNAKYDGRPLGASGFTGIITATIVAEFINSSGTRKEFLLAWNRNTCIHSTRIIMSTSLLESRNPKLTTSLASWSDFDRGYWVPDGWVVDPVAGVVASNPLQEKPCTTCKRNNYLAEKVCWSCGNNPFR